MESELVEQLSRQLGANNLPYVVPIHPNLVHLTLGLFIVGVSFDIVGILFPVDKVAFKYLAIPVTRSGLFDVGWYNTLGAALITFFTVASGIYEMLLSEPFTDVKSAWGLQAMETMLWHAVGGVLLLALISGMTVWRGFQRYAWRKDMARQVQWTYAATGLLVFLLMFLQGTLGAHLGGEFGIHVTADQLLKMGADPNVQL